MVSDAVHRTPDGRFEGLPGFAEYTPHYRERDGLRLAHLDAGEGPPVVMVHGQPTWSYLWRKVIPPLVAAGRRCVVPDHLGFGRSDKPVDPAAYSYERHAALLADLLDTLDLRDATMVVHDWGGPIGLRAAIDRPDRVSRLVLMDTGLVTGRERMSATWQAFRDYVARTPELPVGQLVGAGCHVRPADDVLAAYDAPFDGARSQGGVHAFPVLVPTSPDAPGAAAGARVKAALREDRRPLLMLWAAEDPVFPLEAGEAFAASIGRGIDGVVEGAGHFLQEDRGEEVGALVARWLDGGGG